MSEANRSPARTGARGPYANGQRRRAEIVDAATTVFAEKGFRRVSLRQIAEELGTNHVTLVHHFGSKDALLQAVLARREERDRPMREAILREKGLHEGLPDIMRHNAIRRGIIHLDSTLEAEAIRPDHPAHEFIRRRDDEFATDVLDRLGQERAKGTIRDDLPLPIVARQIVALVEGLQLQWLYDENVDMAEHISVFLEQLKPR